MDATMPIMWSVAIPTHQHTITPAPSQLMWMHSTNRIHISPCIKRATAQTLSDRLGIA
jgi:hypothetical protein